MLEIEVWTNVEDNNLTDIALTIYAKWLAFALGKEALNGRRLRHPTGRYASSIFMRQESPTKIAIFADEELAPEAAVLEHGHGAIDLKQTKAGRKVPLHRGEPGHYGSAGYGDPVVASGPATRGGSIWGKVKAQGFTGVRRVGNHGWVIPPMAPYSPARILAQLFRNQLT